MVLQAREPKIPAWLQPEVLYPGLTSPAPGWATDVSLEADARRQGRKQHARGIHHSSDLTAVRRTASLRASRRSPRRRAAKSHKSGQLEMAETLFRDVPAGYRELHGSDHPHTFDALDNLSRVQAHQGKMAAAECVAREAQMRCAELLGAAHPSTIARTKTLATMLAAQGKYCEAGEIASEVVQRSKQLHGDRQPKESLGVMLRLRDLRMHTIPPDAGVRLVHGQSARR